MTAVLGAREIAEQHTILRAVLGSTAHGLNLPGQDDRDEMGVCIEPPEYVIGLKRFEQWVHRTQPEGVRSGPGDEDIIIYSLRKWARLALNGNPTVLLLLWVPLGGPLVEVEQDPGHGGTWRYYQEDQELQGVCTLLGEQLRALASAFVSKRAGRAFLGYLTAQKERLTGDRGQKRTKREDLVCRFGYDVKYAMHAVRLGHQGCELLETGRVTLPVAEPWRGMLLAIRRGETLLPVVTAVINSFEARLTALLTTSTLPDEPDYGKVNRFLVEAYQDYWGYGLNGSRRFRYGEDA